MLAQEIFSRDVKLLAQAAATTHNPFNPTDVKSEFFALLDEFYCQHALH